MAVYKAIIAYDGTEFEGFQRLAAGQRTVQGVVEEALSRLGWQGRSILAAGRTDAGVHARGQVVSFDLDWRHGLDTLGVALNAHLPTDVSVREVTAAEPGFHPRFSARWRRYRYSLISIPTRDPLAERYAWRVWPRPTLAPMQEAAERLLGEHDFGALGAAPIPGGHTRREVRLARWSAAEERAWFEIEANAFLHRMVRRLVAVLVEVGGGREEPERVDDLLEHPQAAWTGKAAPARGLCLEAVIYD